MALSLQIAAGVLLALGIAAVLQFGVDLNAAFAKEKAKFSHTRHIRRQAAYALVAAVKQMAWGQVNSDATALAWWESQQKSGERLEWWEREHSYAEQQEAHEAWCSMQEPLTAEADARASAKREAEGRLERALADEETQQEGYAFYESNGLEVASANGAKRARRRERGLSNAEREWALFLLGMDEHGVSYAALSHEESMARIAKQHADSLDPVQIAKRQARIAERDGGRGYGDGGPFRLLLPSSVEQEYQRAYAAWHALGGNAKK